MYSKSDWSGPDDPFISIFFPKVEVPEDQDPIVSVVVFEWKDQSLLGTSDDPSTYKKLICDNEAVTKSYCNETNLGEFIRAENATEKSGALILTQAVHLKSSSPIKYPIKKTGYYCVLSDGFNTENYMGVVEFKEAYGELPATQIPKLPFYGGVTILYAVVVVFWGFLYYQHRYDICKLRPSVMIGVVQTNTCTVPVQNYITAILVFLVVEMLMTWGFYGEILSTFCGGLLLTVCRLPQPQRL